MESWKRYCLVLLILFGASMVQPEFAFGQGLGQNKPPLLVYPNPQSMLLGGSLSVKPKLGLTDNTGGTTVSVSSVLPLTFIGNVTVNPAGVVTISDPGAIGTFLIAIQAVDSQGAITIARFRLRVRTIECNYYSPTLATPFSTGVAANKIGPTVGDFNNDGKIDLVVIEDQAEGISLLLGDGTGNFTAPANSFIGGLPHPEEAQSADFNRDGSLDLVLRTAYGFAILHGNGQGGFSLSTNVSSPTSAHTKDLTVGDFNKDGRPDIAYTQSINAEKKLQIYLNSAVLGFVPAPGSPKNLANDPFEIESRDFNNDGNLDLAVQLSGSVFTYLGDGTGAFTTNLQLQFPITPGILNAMLAEDFNHDGNDDLALINSPLSGEDGVLTVYPGTGTGTFSPGSSLPPTGLESIGLISADLNLDGNRDLLSAHVMASGLSQFKNDGYGFFQRLLGGFGPNPPFEGANPMAEDFNNDGQVDIATVNYNGYIGVLLHTTCAPTFTPATIQVARCDGPTLKTLGTVISDDFNGQQLTFNQPFIPGVSITNLTVSGNNLTAMVDATNNLPLGTYSGFLTVTNPDNKLIGGQVIVNVVDCPSAPTPPLSFIPPANINANNSPDSCGAIVNYNAPQTTGGTAPVVVSCSPASGSSFPIGSTTVSCTATDQAGAQTSTSFQVSVADNQAPQLVGLGNITVNAPAGECATVVNFQVNATDNCAGVAVVTSPSSGSLFTAGTTVVTATATDASGNSTTASFTVTVTGSGGPTLSNPVASPNSLWPPNHKMKDVDINYVATPGCGGAVTCTLSVTSNEPVNGLGDGDTAPDWEIINAHRVRLRAERSGAGTGRIYTITVTCTGAGGNQSIKTVTVTVPHN